MPSSRRGLEAAVIAACSSATTSPHRSARCRVRQIVRSVDKPVIAAGGIADAEGVAAVRRLRRHRRAGGHSLPALRRSNHQRLHRKALQKPRCGAHRADQSVHRPPAAASSTASCASKARSAPSRLPSRSRPQRSHRCARRRGRRQGDFSPLWSGQNPSGCRAVPAAELTRALAALV